MRRVTKSRPAGFTLVELMVVLLIIAILAAIAIPSYQTMVRKGRRTDAKTAVLDLAGREERYYTAANQYTTDATQLGYSGTTWGSTKIGSGYYTITAANGSTNDTNSFLIYATPVAGTSQALDSQCQYFSVDNTGRQFASDTNASGTDNTSICW